MPKVDAGTAGPGWGCTCPSQLKDNQVLKALARASQVSFAYKRTEPDGTLVFQAWTRPEAVYDVTYHPEKPGKLCKHAIACSSYVVGPWLRWGCEEVRKEMESCRKTRSQLKKAQRTVTRLQKSRK